MTKLSVILPTRNEEELIGKALLDISKFLDTKRYSYEILIILNGSVDNTKEIVDKLSAKNKNIKVMNSKPGYGFALRKGMLEAKGTYVTIFNVDFYDLKLIDLVDIDLYGKDLVIGSKMTNWAEDKRPWKRRVVSVLYNVLLKTFFDFKGSDTHGIKIMRKKVMDSVLKKCKTTSGILDTEFVIKSQRDGYEIADLPVSVEEKRIPRFVNRFLSTPVDLINLYKALK